MAAVKYGYDEFEVKVDVLMEGGIDATRTVRCVSTVRTYARDVTEAAENAAAMFVPDVRIRSVSWVR